MLVSGQTAHYGRKPPVQSVIRWRVRWWPAWECEMRGAEGNGGPKERGPERSEEHTSELQAPCNLVCRLLLDKKNGESPSYTFHAAARCHTKQVRLHYHTLSMSL